MATGTFGSGVRVAFRDDVGARHKGRVTSVQDKRRWVMTDDHKRVSVPVRRLRKTSGADAIFAYNGLIGATDSRLGDISLYELMIHEPWLRPKTIAERVNRVLRALGVPFEGKQSLIRAVPA